MYNMIAHRKWMGDHGIQGQICSCDIWSRGMQLKACVDSNLPNVMHVAAKVHLMLRRHAMFNMNA